MPASSPTHKHPVGTLRTEFFYDQYFLMVIMTLSFLTLIGACVLWAIFEYRLQNIPDLAIKSPTTLRDRNGNVVLSAGAPMLKFPTTFDGKLLYPTPLSEPFLSTPALLEWAVEAITNSYAFNFINYEAIINNASIYYTKAGYQNYRRTLIETNIANSVDRRKYVLSVTPTSAPIILKDKPTPDGIFSWQIQFPIQMTYQNVRETQKLDWIITMLILRVPLTESPSGVAIAALIVREGKYS
ncbi:MAG: DotI/IcmL family type IV secretion protein [Proteobacteria bacterium]|nr:DotI/IcmL family type IV secretion protein [Pseudomonadota bacterium]